MTYEARSILVIDAAPFLKSLPLLPAVRALRMAYPKTYLAVAASRGTVELITAGRLITEAIDLGVIRTGRSDYAGAAKRLLRLLKHTRRNQFDLVLDFSSTVETQIASRFGSRVRTITPARLPHILDTLFGRRAGQVLAGTRYASYASVLSQLGIGFSERGLDMELSVEENVRFEQLLARKGSRGGEPVVVFHATSAGMPHGWPVEYYAELAERLAKNFGARIVAVDEPGDESFTRAIGGKLPQGAIRLTAVTAMQFASAVARASLVVTGERDMGMLASDFGTPVLEIAFLAPATRMAEGHRVVAGVSRTIDATDEAFDVACEMLQESRTPSLFRR